MTIVYLMMLAAVWVAVLLPPVLRKRAEVRPAASISSFRKQLIVLERTSPANWGSSGRPNAGLRPVRSDGIMLLAPAPSRVRFNVSRVRRRRQRVLLALLGADAVALILCVVGLGGAAVLAVLVTVGATTAYVSLLARMQRLRVERRLKLRHLPRPVVVIEPAIEVRRSAAL